MIAPRDFLIKIAVRYLRGDFLIKIHTGVRIIFRLYVYTWGDSEEFR